MPVAGSLERAAKLDRGVGPRARPIAEHVLDEALPEDRKIRLHYLGIGAAPTAAALDDSELIRASGLRGCLRRLAGMGQMETGR